ncbi:replication initiation factor domain-containing protein [Streptococcus gallolyticus subsp. gallolyticus]|uniref:replication initiation factor domain-containing protein n=1 Tax=Streptococcus gallolyticus TaxID=315405 RepID=UPI0020012DF4|nr:replication initiation factor domain-containing protein [Streptococcus gallolyticus]MCY7173167.1 replication initiation factor domain-containing protein [Streptococcus gallolyticus subsp. gallolyticus]MCY7175289.1 replication initiation factor domain-containing protein [Streptococcus gallolyticus subsp. gallolyticus]MCY7179744.1 replication initiation factor domain-containing protein [Streptococcus gallolyticus subsp. gallolyticus]MCY7197295.1 replication initiation factor domain-containing 
MTHDILQNIDFTSKYLHVGVDELTIVIQPNEETIGECPNHWNQIATELSEIIAEKLSLPSLFGEMVREQISPQGYTTSYSFENMPYFLRIAFHEGYLKMGIIIKFSASALSLYKQAYENSFKEPIGVYEILKKLDEPYWNMHLSRIDFCADYLNFPLSVNDIYNNLKSKKFEIINYKGNRNHKKMSAIEIDAEAKTVTIGSRKKGSNSFLKIYDKLTEQLENNGRYAQIAQQFQSWTRFEVTFRGQYAKQLTKLILSLSSRDMLQQFIANKILEKYCLIDAETGQLTEYSEALIDFSTCAPPLVVVSPRNNQLMQSIHYILKGSGFFPMLEKVKKTWGIYAVSILLKRLLFEYEHNYIPNEDVAHWVKKNALELQVLEFETYLDSVIEIFYIKNAPSSPKSAKKSGRKNAE